MPSDDVARPGRRWWRGANARLGVGVGVWWLLIGAGVALTLPDPVVAVPTRAPQLVAASTAHVYLLAWPGVRVPETPDSFLFNVWRLTRCSAATARVMRL
jgi:hypothetical protein